MLASMMGLELVDHSHHINNIPSELNKIPDRDSVQFGKTPKRKPKPRHEQAAPSLSDQIKTKGAWRGVCVCVCEACYAWPWLLYTASKNGQTPPPC